MKRTAGYWLAAALMVASTLRAVAADPWQHIAHTNQALLPSDEIQAIKYWADSRQAWICTSSGAVKLENGALSPLAATKGLTVWDILPRPEGGYWIGHSDGALLVDGELKATTLKGLTVASIQQVGAELWAIAKDAKTDINNLMLNKGVDWTALTRFKEVRFLDLIPDSRGLFWLVLDGDGVLEFDPRKGGGEAKHHLAMRNVTSVLTDSKGRTWCGLIDGGVMVRENDAWKMHLEKERSAVLALVEDGAGRLWAATSGNGVWMYDGVAWKGLLQSEGAISLLKVTADKRVWVCTQQRAGLQYWNGQVWTLSLANGMPIRCLVELADGTLVAGGLLDGLYVLGTQKIKGE